MTKKLKDYIIIKFLTINIYHGIFISIIIIFSAIYHK